MDVETYISENLALHRKLESKEEALIILSHDLAKCKEERDELKKLFLNGSSTSKSLVHFERYGYVDSDAVKALNDKNKALFIEIRDLRHKLQNAYTDLKVLRAERWAKSDSLHQKEELVQEVEEAKAQLKELRSDLQALLDEKEELITERDAYRCKVHRLNHELAMALKASPSLDVDAVLMESRFMKERLEQALTEIEITKHMLSKYKGMLDKKKLKGAIKLGTNDESSGRILTHKQVIEFLEKEEPVWQHGVMNKEATLSDLRGLCMALVDSLQDKSLYLMHQKKTDCGTSEDTGRKTIKV
ncbi:coiled-coil domain-containing protein 149 isoform X2 [Halyomorpha halys]|uniref:coiled-coil domain-containing protein 149 isoform X2 n=1 Tax=Halyomorpha halys TaxID=286706 RepID=UPI0006D4CA25|nr:coiled-coil domain-containing protein 149 isoform X2 [Halyomorpha halys]